MVAGFASRPDSSIFSAGLDQFYRGKRIAVTGGAGTIGAALVDRLLGLDVREVRVLDNNESELFAFAEREERMTPFLCDIGNADHLVSMLQGIDLVFHAAALKHVVLCERSPSSAVSTNIVGLQNVIHACAACGVKRMLFTSSDKAVNSTNVMGTSKLMGERLVTAANATGIRKDRTVFFSTRFGNVAGSRGSVIPLFCRQLAEGRKVTVTHSDMTRFVMSLSEAVDLLLEGMVLGVGGEVFVTKMPVMRIMDLARAMIKLLAPVHKLVPGEVEIVEIGPRPGEKMFEELTSAEEIRRTFDIGNFFVILPAFRNLYEQIEYDYPGLSRQPVERLYISSQEPLMSEEEILNFLRLPGTLPANLVEAVHQPVI